MADIRRVETRLEHVRAVEPILGALRTISLGSWQSALNRRRGLQEYRERLEDVLSVLVTHLRGPKRGHSGRRKRPGRRLALIVGSERGLCGRLNHVVLAEAEAYLDEKRAQGVDIDIAALGNRAIRILRRRGYELTWSGRLSLTALPDYDLARELSLRWLRRHEAGEIDGVDVIYNTYAEIGRYEPIVETLVPPRLPPVTRADRWPPVVIDTDPRRLVARVLEQWAVVDLHARLLDAAASEHSARYQLMEGAVKNAERLIDELTQQVNIARQQEITTEMQELAVGAGLLDTQRDG